MQNIHTAPLEVLSSRSNGEFATEPYEAGWATEATAMLYIRERHAPAARLKLRVQISVDGARWFDHPTRPLVASQPGGYAIPVTHFGNWLRLVGAVTGGPKRGGVALVIDLYWVLKG